MGPATVKYATGEMERLGLGTSACEPGVDGAKLFVGSLPRTITEDELREFFSKFGAITEVFVMRDTATGTGRGCAFVKMALKEDALYAIQSLAGKHQWEGCARPLEVRFAESKSQRMQNMGESTGFASRLEVQGASARSTGVVRGGVCVLRAGGNDDASWSARSCRCRDGRGQDGRQPRRRPTAAEQLKPENSRPLEGVLFTRRPSILPQRNDKHHHLGKTPGILPTPSRAALWRFRIWRGVRRWRRIRRKWISKQRAFLRRRARRRRRGVARRQR